MQYYKEKKKHLGLVVQQSGRDETLNTQLIVCGLMDSVRAPWVL